jgi:hypothetical protein
MNAGATFQREMDIAFIEETGKFIVVYLDDVTVFSNLMMNTYDILEEFSRSVEVRDFVEPQEMSFWVRRG